MIFPDHLRREQACEWARRIANADFSDWHGHMLWLEQHPGNAGLFDQMSLQMETGETDEIADRVIITANDNIAPSGKRPRWRWHLGGLALSAGAIASLMMAYVPQSVIHVIKTKGGMRQDIRLPDGTQIALNGASRLRVIDDRLVALDQGEAFFNVAHDDRHPFTVQVGNALVRDIGTAFDAVIEPSATVIAVEEGMVSIDPQSSNIHVAAGQEARIGRGGQVVRQMGIQPDAIGGWRTGRLVYRSTPLADVAKDMSRSLGVTVSVTPRSAEQLFTGVVVVDKNPELTLQKLGGAAGMAVVRDDSGWRLSDR